jgi:hypothetical protein
MLTFQEAVMKTQNIHIGSFLIGLLAGSVILLALALSQPLQAETQTSQRLRNESRQIQVSTSRSFGKTWSQIRAELTLNGQRTVLDIRQSINKDLGRIGSNFQPCVWLGWLDRQIVNLAARVNIHLGFLNPPACPA